MQAEFHIESRNAPMRVFIAEAVEPVRRRLKELVREQDGVELVAVEQTLERFIERVRTTRPHLVLLGTRLADATSFEALEQMRGVLHSTPVVLLCDRIDGQYLYHANILGVDYVLELNRDIEFLPSLLRQMARNHAKAHVAYQSGMKGEVHGH